MALLAANVAPLYAQAPMPVAFVPDQVGVAAAVRGRVELTRPGAVGRIVQSGQPVFLGDAVTTDAAGTLQILLADETVFTIGPNSALTIDEFVYDPATSAGKVSASVVKGVFRFVTGKVAQRDPQAMEVKLPAGLIGIRGTIVAGRTEGTHSLVVLLGPGAKNNTGERPGQITVGNAAGTGFESVTVTRPGYGTEIAGPGVPPTPPALVDPAILSALTASLESATPSSTAPAAAPDVAGDSAAELAGQTLVEALQSLFGVSSLSELLQVFAEETTTAAEDAADVSTAIADGTATKDQLRTIETGQFHYEFDGTFTQTIKNGAIVSINGTVETDIDIDFGARTVGGGNSEIEVNTSSFGGNIFSTEVVEAQSFASGSGNAVFTDSGGGLTGTITLNNSGGTIAATATGSATFDNGLTGSSRNAGSTGDITVSRKSGLSAAD